MRARSWQEKLVGMDTRKKDRDKEKKKQKDSGQEETLAKVSDVNRKGHSHGHAVGSVWPMEKWEYGCILHCSMLYSVLHLFLVTPIPSLGHASLEPRPLAGSRQFLADLGFATLTRDSCDRLP